MWDKQDKATPVKLPKIESLTTMAAHIGRPQLASVPGKAAVLVCDGYRSGYFDLESSHFTNIHKTAGLVAGRMGTIGATCDFHQVSLYDFSLKRQYSRLPELDCRNDPNLGSLTPWYESPSMSLNGERLCYSVWLGQNSSASEKKATKEDLNLVLVWDVSMLGACRERLTAPYPIIQPISTADWFRRAQSLRMALAEAETFLINGDPGRSMSLVEEILANADFHRSGDALSLRWRAGRLLVRERLTGVIQRASQDYGDSFAYVPDGSTVLVQSTCIDDSLLWEFSPDTDGECMWVHGRNQPRTKIGVRLKAAFGPWGARGLVGYDPITNAVYLESRVLREESEVEHIYHQPRNCGKAVHKAIRDGLMMIIGQHVDTLPTESAPETDFCPVYRQDAVVTPFRLFPGSEASGNWPTATDYAFFGRQPVLFTTAERNGYITAWDGFSRRYTRYKTEIERATLVRVSLTGMKVCVAGVSGEVSVSIFPKFEMVWKRVFPDSLDPDAAPKLIQFSCDEKLLLIGVFRCLYVVNTETSETLWEWNGEYRDAILTIDSRFIIISKKDGFDCYELEWFYRGVDQARDWDRMLDLAKALIASDFQFRGSDSFEPGFDSQPEKARQRLRKILKLVGLGGRTETEVDLVLRHAWKEGSAEGKVVAFDDWEYDQVMFPFFWEIPDRQSGVF